MLKFKASNAGIDGQGVMPSWLGTAAAIITIVTFPITVVQALRGFEPKSPEVLSQVGFLTGSGVFSIAVFIFLAFMFGLFFSKLIHAFCILDRVFLMVAHPILGLVSGLQSVVFVEFLLGFNAKELSGIGPMSMMVVLLSLSLAMENALIEKRFDHTVDSDADSDTQADDDAEKESRHNDLSFVVIVINTVFFGIAWWVFLVEVVEAPTVSSMALQVIAALLVPAAGFFGTVGLLTLIRDP